jgi:uncharacterized alkaline shock family protein YloU
MGGDQPKVQVERWSRRRVSGLMRGAVADLTIETPRGTITISRDVVAEIVAETAARCYGVVGLSSASRVGRMLRREGVGVEGGPTDLRIELHVVIEHGLNLAEVAATVRSQVAYEVERLTGLGVASVEVVVQDVRASA